MSNRPNDFVYYSTIPYKLFLFIVVPINLLMISKGLYLFTDIAANYESIIYFLVVLFDLHLFSLMVRSKIVQDFYKAVNNKNNKNYEYSIPKGIVGLKPLDQYNFYETTQKRAIEGLPFSYTIGMMQHNIKTIVHPILEERKLEKRKIRLYNIFYSVIIAFNISFMIVQTFYNPEEFLLYKFLMMGAFIFFPYYCIRVYIYDHIENTLNTWQRNDTVSTVMKKKPMENDYVSATIKHYID